MKNTLLYVDDEEKNLSSFKAVFRKDYDVILAKSAQEGFEKFQEHEIKVVVSDQRMPNETGVEFLEKVALAYPNTIRIILTGYSDYEAILDSINKAKVYKFIPKPWKKEEFKDLLDKALEMFDLRKQNSDLSSHLKVLNNELDQFIYSAAHDLKAPILTLKGLVSLAKEENEIDLIKELIDKKEKTILKLEHFIGEINQYARNLRLKVENELIDFKALTTQALSELKDDENFECSTFAINIDDAQAFYSDKSRLHDIIYNLLSNAIKFKDPQKASNLIKVDIHCGTDQAKITIGDIGVGIDPSCIESIFDMFYRGLAKSTGSGLGLYLVKQSVYKLKGDIHVQSTLGQGTTFELFIPNMPFSIAQTTT